MDIVRKAAAAAAVLCTHTHIYILKKISWVTYVQGRATILCTIFSIGWAEGTSKSSIIMNIGHNKTPLGETGSRDNACSGDWFQIWDGHALIFSRLVYELVTIRGTGVQEPLERQERSFSPYTCCHLHFHFFFGFSQIKKIIIAIGVPRDSRQYIWKSIQLKCAFGIFGDFYNQHNFCVDIFKNTVFAKTKCISNFNFY